MGYFRIMLGFMIIERFWAIFVIGCNSDYAKTECWDVATKLSTFLYMDNLVLSLFILFNIDLKN